MKKIFTALTLSMLTAVLASGQIQATLLGNWHDDDIIMTSWLNSRYNESYGFAINGGEYGVLGSTEGIHIISVTDPNNIYEAARIEGAAQGDFLVHRDFKTYDGYLFCVADEGSSSTLQVIDLHGLPAAATQVYSSNEFVITAHNIYIDEANARAYIIGDGNGLKVLDISNPAQPVWMGSGGGTFVPYCHDAYIRDHIGYLNCAGDGLWIVDYTDPNNIQILGTMSDYPEAGYNHSGWLSDDGQYYFLCDETHSSSLKTVDVSDPANMSVVALFSPDVWSGEIPHNALVRGNRLYVSYYYDGLQVWDVSDPINPVHIAQYDTYQGPNETFYAGMWGVYPLLPSGNIVCGDLQSGLFLFEALPEVINDFSLSPSQTNFEGCEGQVFTFQMQIGDDYTGPVTLTLPTQPVVVDVNFSANPAQPGETVTVTLTFNGGTNGQQELIVGASDGTNSGSAFLNVDATAQPSPSNLGVPAEGAQVLEADAIFTWSPADDAADYRLQVTNSTANFSSGLLLSATTPNTEFEPTLPQINNILTGSAPYHWRVLSQNACGEAISAVRQFDFDDGLATGELNGATLNIFPSPATDQVFVRFDRPLASGLSVEITALTGQVLSQKAFAAGENTLMVDVSTFAAGIYLLKITDGTASHVQRIVVE